MNRILISLLLIAYSTAHIKSQYDFIVVGVGTVGSTILGRLNEANADVIGFEAGANWEFNGTSLKTQWGSYNYFTDPDANRGGYIGFVQGGRRTGGSMYVTNNGWEIGYSQWWDHFEQVMGDERYSYNTSQCVFNNIISRPYLSETGKIHVRQSNSDSILGQVWKNISSQYNVNTYSDCNNYNTDVNKFCFEPSSTRWSAGNNQTLGSRDTSWAEYVRPQLYKSRVVWGARVVSLISRTKRGITEYSGVTVLINGTYHTVRAKYGVILSTNALHSAQLLGMNGNGLQDGGSVSVTYSTNIPSSHYAAGNTSKVNTKIAAYWSSPYAPVGKPDFLVLGVVFPSGTSTQLTMLGFNLESKSRGEIYSVENNPLTAPNYRFSYLQDIEDVNRFVSFYNISRQFAAQLSQVGGYSITEFGPSAGKYSYTDLAALVRSAPENGGVANVNHWSGTVTVNANMQPPQTEGLFVCDSSIYPKYPGAGGAAPSIYLGEVLSQQLTKRYYHNRLRYVYDVCF